MRTRISRGVSAKDETPVSAKTRITSSLAIFVSTVPWELPVRIRNEKLRGHLWSRYGVIYSGSYGDLAGKLFRLGHMAMAAHPTYLTVQLTLLERTLIDLGHRCELGVGVGAALQALSDWGKASSNEAFSKACNLLPKAPRALSVASTWCLVSSRFRYGTSVIRPDRAHQPQGTVLVRLS